MKIRISLLFVGLVIFSLVASGCTDILTKQKVGDFGDAQGTGAVTTVPTPGTLGASSSGNIAQMRQGSIYATCYSGCTNAKKKSVHDCDKACCLAQCQPRSPDDTKRCAAICGVDLEKTTDI
jgi:hypothetical protein